MADKKKSLSYGKLIFIGVIWTFLYLKIAVNGCFFLFGFNLLSASDWVYRLVAFLDSRWIINTSADFGLFCCMLLFVPLWLIGWWGLYLVHWKKFIPKRLFEKKIKRNVIKIASDKKGFAPHKLRVQSSALLSVAPIAPNTISRSDPEDVLPHPYPSDQEGKEKIDQSQSDIMSDEQDIQAILPLTTGTRADFFPHISMNGHYAAFALSTDSRAVVFHIINQPDSTWIVDTDVDIKQSDWYSERRVLDAPLTSVIEIAKSLHESEPNSIAVPAVLMMSGSLMNASETRDYLEKNGVMLLRLDEVDADDIPLFTDFLNEYFNSNQDDE